jgi:hypothetical protein
MGAAGRLLRCSTPWPLSLSQFQYAVIQTTLGLANMQILERERDKARRMSSDALTAVNWSVLASHDHRTVGLERCRTVVHLSKSPAPPSRGPSFSYLSVDAKCGWSGTGCRAWQTSVFCLSSSILGMVRSTEYRVPILVGEILLPRGCMPWICFKARHAHQRGTTMRLLETCAASDMFTALRRHTTQDIQRQQRNMQVTVV